MTYCLLPRALPSWLLASLLLTACESKPAARPPVAAPRPVAAPAGVPLPLKPQPAHEVAAASPDVPALHEPLLDSTTVAPGLQLIISSVPVPDTAVIRDPGDLHLVLTIRRNRQVIFRDTVADGLTYTEYSEPGTARLYPIWVPTGPGAGELLVAYNNRPSRDRARRFFIRGSQVVKVDTLPTFDGPATDADRDGKLEYSGLNDYGETWSEGQAQYQTYNPTLYYEVRPTGLAFDSALTKRRARAKYGIFRGYKYSETPGMLVK